MYPLAAIAAWLLRMLRGSLSPEQVDAELEKLAAASKDDLDWHNSITDLLKLLQQEHGWAARKDLARELGYRGTASDGSAEKNEWLHAEVMRRLASQEIAIPPAKP